MTQQMVEQVVGLFSTQQDAEAAKQTLEAAGLASEQVVINTQSMVRQLPIRETEAFNNGMGGGAIGALLGGVLGLIFGLLVNDVSKPGLSATPHVSPVLLMVAGGGIGAIALGVIASLTGSRVASPQAEGATSHAVVVTGTEGEFIKATQIIQSIGEH
jgi:hypothetical protein